MNSLLRCLIVFVLALLTTEGAWAGMDDTQTIIRITGEVEVRGRVERGDMSLKFTHWVAAKEGDVLGPGCSVRTSMRSTVRMRLGDASYHPKHGDSVQYTTVQPRALILLHGYHNKKKLLEVVHGKITREANRM